VKRHWTKFVLTILVLSSASAPVFAQYLYEQEAPRWSLTGDLGFDFSRDRLSSHGSGFQGTNATSQYGGTVDANLHGYLFNPLFLDFNATVNDLQSSTGSQSSFQDGGSLPSIDNRTGALNYSFNGIFLSGRSMPLMFHFIKTDDGLSSSLLRHNQGTREYGFDWRPKLPHLRSMYVTYRDNRSEVAIPTSFYQTNNSQKTFQFNANDNLLGWDWSTNFSDLAQNVGSIGLAILPQNIIDHAWSQNFDIRRDFLDQLFTFSAGENMTRDHSLSSEGRSQFNLLGYHSGLTFRPTEKFWAGATYSHEEFESGLSESFGLPPGTGSIFALPLTRIDSLAANTNYRPYSFFNLNGSLTYSKTAMPVLTETLEKTITPQLTASVTHRWRGFDFNGVAGGGYRITTSNFGSTTDGGLYNFAATVSRGSLQNLRWTTGFQLTHDILPQMLGSYTNTGKWNLQAETYRFAHWRLSAGADYTRYNNLTIGGKFVTNGVGFNVGAQRERYGARFYRTYSAGNGATFAGFVPANEYIVHLPLDQLIGSPLLDRTTHLTGLTGFYIWKRWVVNGTMTRERDLLQINNQTFNYINLDVRYSLGKFTLDAGYSRNLLETNPDGMHLNGTVFNRFRVRLTRAFNVF
jgi:hypothetical protein